MREETKQALYGLIEERVLARRGVLPEREYLTLLGASLPALRKAYRNPTVAVDYANPHTIDAYLLAYVPHYVFTASAALQYVPCDELLTRFNRGLHVVCVGGGPLPELVALVDRLLSCGARDGSITLTSMDVNAATWAVAAADMTAIARTLAPNFRVHVASQTVDCRQERHQDAALGPPCDVLFMQNCLNEVAGTAHFDGHTRAYATSVRQGGYVVISDLTEYDLTSDAVAYVEAYFSKQKYQAMRIFERSPMEVVSPFAYDVPGKIYHAFFGYEKDAQTGEARFPDSRWPRRRLKFSSSVWQKP